MSHALGDGLRVLRGRWGKNVRVFGAPLQSRKDMQFVVAWRDRPLGWGRTRLAAVQDALRRGSPGGEGVGGGET
jgi:hypothetical protein